MAKGNQIEANLAKATDSTASSYGRNAIVNSEEVPNGKRKSANEAQLTAKLVMHFSFHSSKMLFKF